MLRNVLPPSLRTILGVFSPGAITRWSRISRRGVHERLMEEHLAAVPPGVPLYHNALPEFKKEISRSRRLDHPLCVVIMGLVPPVDESEIRSDPRLHDRSTQLHLLRRGDAIREVVREIDIVAYDSKREQYVMLLPVTTGAQATKSVNRVTSLFAKDTMERLGVGIAEFPVDGLFVEDLLQVATRRARQASALAQ